jgi:hypothetical protein
VIDLKVMIPLTWRVARKKPALTRCCRVVGITLGIKEERTTEGSLWDHAIVDACGGRSNSFSLIAAAATALLLGLIAHDAMGMPIDVIRIDALGAAGLIFAAVAGGSLLKR